MTSEPALVQAKSTTNQKNKPRRISPRKALMPEISERRYGATLEGIEEGYFEVDLSGNMTFFNDALCRILGYSREKL